MHVHLITRINLKYDPKFVFTEERMQVLEKNVNPLVKSQRYKGFEWIALIAEDTDKETFDRLIKIFDQVYTSYKQYLEDYSGQEVLSIRLDSDDYPGENYVGSIVDAVDKEKDIQLIVANRGIDVNTITGEHIEVEVDYPIGFFGLYEKSLTKGCYEKDHKKMNYSTVYLSNYTKKYLWTRNIHDTNWGSKSLLYKYKINAV